TCCEERKSGRHQVFSRCADEREWSGSVDPVSGFGDGAAAARVRGGCVAGVGGGDSGGGGGFCQERRLDLPCSIALVAMSTQATLLGIASRFAFVVCGIVAVLVGRVYRWLAARETAHGEWLVFSGALITVGIIT